MLRNHGNLSRLFEAGVQKSMAMRGNWCMSGTRLPPTYSVDQVSQSEKSIIPYMLKLLWHVTIYNFWWISATNSAHTSRILESCREAFMLTTKNSERCATDREPEDI